VNHTEQALIIISAHFDEIMAEHTAVMESNKTNRLKLDLSNILIDDMSKVSKRIYSLLDSLKEQGGMSDECWNTLHP